MLVAVAVLIGVVLLAKGFNDDGGFVTATKSDTASDQGNSQGGDVPTTETTEPAVAVDPAHGQGVRGQRQRHEVRGPPASPTC